MYSPRMLEPGRYEFGLGAEDESRARQLHEQCLVIDMLSQHVGGAHIYRSIEAVLQPGLSQYLEQSGGGWRAVLAAAHWPYKLELEGKSTVLGDWYKQSGLNCGSFNVVVSNEDQGEDALWYESLLDEQRQLPWVRHVTSAEDILRAREEGAIAFYGNCQPVSPIPRSLQAVDRAYGRGLRSLMLTYNRMDFVGVGCAERVDGGLSYFGAELVKHCNDLGIIVDTSHCGRMTTLDACSLSKVPVTSNHSCAQSVTPVARAKSDDELRAIADTGGVIGVVAVPFFIAGEAQPSVEAMLDHVDYIAELVGWEHVALGTDYPLQAPIEIAVSLTGAALNADLGFRPEDKLDPTLQTLGFEDYRDLPNITRGLVKRGYTDEQIGGILGANALRVFAAVCG